MQKFKQLNVFYIAGSVIYVPLCVFVGIAQTSGVGDAYDSSYYLPNGSFDYATRNSEFNRAALVTLGMSAIGIILGVVSLVTLIVIYKQGTITKLALTVRGLLTLIILSGYVSAIFFVRGL